MEEYSHCFKVDIEKVDSLLMKEEKRVKLELERAEKKSALLVENMKEFLNGNEELLRKF